MAKLITTYDSTLKEKVFVLKGEEAYAKSTDTVLTELNREEDWNRHLDYMLIGFEVDVHRNVGESSIVLYDNDEVIDVIPFDLGSSSVRWEKYYDEDLGEWVDNRMKLAYGIEHNIYAKYMGNKQCLKSQSKTYKFSEEMPDAYLSSLEFVDVESYYDADSNVDISVQLSADDYYSGQSVKLYDNSSLVATATTDSSGVAVFEDVTILQGLHNFVARFSGTEFLVSSETSVRASGGYTITITKKPSYIINNGASSVTVLAKDYLDIPKQNIGIVIQEYDNNQWVNISQTVNTNSNGLAVINQVNISDNPFKAYNSQFDYSSAEYTVASYDNVTISVQSSSNLVETQYNYVISGTVSNVSEPVSVTLQQSHYASGRYNLTTDADGNFSVNITSMGRGGIDYTASCGNVQSSTSVEEVLIYWNATGTSYYSENDYRMRLGSISKLTNGWKCTTEPNKFVLQFNRSAIDDYSQFLSFNILSNNGVVGIGENQAEFLPLNSSTGQIVMVYTPNVDGDNGIVYIMQNGSFIGSLDWKNNTSYTFSLTGNANSNIIINNVKLGHSVSIDESGSPFIVNVGGK